MVDWTGLRKHVVMVAYLENLPDGVTEVEKSDAGYFRVTFDHSESHGGGTYYYPATEEKVAQFKRGELNTEEFYSW